ncbi:unnamed protein product, partial [Echinostoma caproni]|uniref:Reverse transcriptase domain-containing protein n=1 Tax=Echinostoma caproni TaxID=27848 RepID=A0A183B3B9_9TREM
SSDWRQFSSEQYSTDSRIPKFNTIPITTIWRRALKILVIEPLNLHESPSEVEEWVERFELWCSSRKGGMLNQSILFLTLGGRELYSLVKNLAFLNVPAEFPFEKLKFLLLDHIPPVDFQATERAKFNSMIRAANMPCREFILQLNKQASKCNYGDRLEEQLCDRHIAGINNISLQRKMVENKDIMLDEARKICEQIDDLCAATNADTPVLFRRRSTKPLRDAPNVHNSPQVPQVPSSSRTQPKSAINHCFSCGEYHLRSTYENSSPICTLQTSEPNGHFVFAQLRFESGVEHRFIMDTGSSESILPKSALNAICPNAVLAPTSVRIHGVTGHQLQLLGEAISCVQSESGVSIPIRFLVPAHSPSILGLRAMRLLQGFITLHTNNNMPIASHLQHLIVQCSSNVGGMKVLSMKLEVDGEPIFRKPRVLPYSQREGVLKTLQNMEQDDVISNVESSAWAIPIVLVMEGDGRKTRICGDYRLTLNLRLRRCAATTMEPEDFVKSLHGC